MATNNSWNSPALNTDGNLLIGSTGNPPVQAALTAPAAGVTITGGAGSITFALANDLAGVEGLSGTGLATRTASDTWTTRTIAGTASRISLSNGDGVSGNPTVDIDAAYVGQTSITTLGTVATGTWSATAIGETKGGTNQTTYTTGDILYASASNTLSKLAATVDGYVLTLASGVPSWAAAGGGVTWVEETTTSRTAAVNEAIVCNNAGLVTVTLPDTAAFGSILRIVGKGAGGWRLAQNASENIRFGSSVTTTGVGGRLDSTNQYDAIELVCTVANTTWTVISSIGNITVT